MIEELISVGILGVLLYISTKMAVINDMTHEIRDILLNRGKPPLPPYDAEKHSECYPFM